MQENIQNAIQQAMENAPERKFVESFEMAITLKDVDLKNPESSSFLASLTASEDDSYSVLFARLIISVSSLHIIT